MPKTTPHDGATDTSVHGSPPDQVAAVAAGSRTVPHVVAGQLSPDAWAEILFPRSPSGRMHDDAWKHASANVLHGWAAYAQRTGHPIVLDQSTYEAAIAAASGNEFKPFPPADYRTKG